MKKSLLFALAAVTMLSANAQMRAQKAHTGKLPERTEMFGNVQVKQAQKAEGTVKKTNAPKKVGANKAKYYRPAGTFYANWDETGAGYIMPYLHAKPYQELTFKNASTAAQAGSNWTYDLWNSEKGARDTVDVTSIDFTNTYGEYYGMVPKLTTTNGDSYVCTQGARVDANLNITAGPAYGGVMSVVNTTEATGEETNMLVSPHYYGSSTRAYDNQYGWVYYSGATDQDGGNSAYWFGRNWRGDFNAVAIAAEKPNQPYVLNRVFGYVTALKGTAEFPLTCRVYRLDEMPQYMEDDCNDLDPMMFDDEHLLASGTATVTSEMLEDGNAIIPFDLESYDPEFDMNIQITPEIDCAIMIVISGYAVDECQGLSFLITNDQEDEGHGEFAYMLATAEDGTITRCLGLNNFFTSGAMTPGMSIFMDVSLPFMIYNFVDETGEYTFPNEGGNYKFAGKYEGISLYGQDQYGENLNADNVYITLEDGSDVPEWLTITLANATGDYEGAVDAKVTCAALPAGVQGREAYVKFYINGANLVYHFIQGEVGGNPGLPGDSNGDGLIDIADVNAAINMMLGKADNNMICDMNGDGVIDIADVNAIINAMLGK